MQENVVTKDDAGSPSGISLVPIIDDILRTQYCVPQSVLLVEHVDIIPVSKTGRWRTVRLLLGDGDLCIQALTSREMHRFIDAAEVKVGSYLQVNKFSVNSQNVSVDERDRSQDERMVYLILEDFTTVGFDQAYRKLWEQHQQDAAQVPAEEDDLDLEEINLEYTEEQAEAAQAPEDVLGPGHATTKLSAPVEAATQNQDENSDLEDAFEAFEAVVFPTSKRQTAKTPSSVASSSKPQPSAVALPRDWHNPQTPLKLTVLRAIPELPYKQNWSCNVLAIITSLSDIEPSHIFPYRQRTARLADPSTAKQVQLTVFLDPDDFLPRIGSALLLVGVKNHRSDEGSLKKYASDRRHGRWWFENPTELAWCNVDGILQWWKQMELAAEAAS